MVGGGTEITTDSLGPVCKESPENVLKWQKSLQVDESLRIKIFTYKINKQNKTKPKSKPHRDTAKEYHPRSSKLSLFPNCLLRISKHQLNLLE